MAIYRCKSPFATSVGGSRRVVSAGELVADTDPVFKGREIHFEPVETYVNRVAEKRVTSVTSVEQATAAPGEKRERTEAVRPRRGRPPGSKSKPKNEEGEGDQS